MLKQLSNQLLILFDFSFVFTFLELKLLSKFVDFFFLLVQDLNFLFFAWLITPVSNVVVNFLDVLLVLLNCFGHVQQFFVHLLQNNVVFFDAVLKAFSRFGKRQIQIVGLELEVLLLFDKHNSLFFQMLSSLLQSVLAKTHLCIAESVVDFFKLVSGGINVLDQHLVFFFQFLVIIPLFWVQVVQSCLVLELNLLNLLFIMLDLVFHVLFLAKQVIKVISLFIILIFNVHIQSFNIFWLCVTSVFV